jgi:cytochrome c oxidase assembly protein subunit 15
MVKSGLKKEIIESGEPARVSPYRLSAHLASAFVLYLITLSAGVRILAKKTPLSLTQTADALTKLRLAKVYRSTHGLAGLTFMTAVTGAFVAGLDAGMLYNSFPLMGDRMVPTDIWIDKLSWKNITENPTTVQFIHRCMAISTIVGISGMWAVSRRLPLPPTVRRAFNLVMAAAWAQGTLGVLTLLYMVPIPVASAHQAGSLALLSSFIWLISIMKRIPK